MKALDRRTFLRGAGVCLALPFLDVMIPVGKIATAATRSPATKRLVCLGNPFGMLPDAFFPIGSGADYVLPDLLEPLVVHRDDFTVFSHLDHGVTGGHRTAHTFLSGVRIADALGMPEGNITLDQKAAEFVGVKTRFPVLNVSINGHCEMSWTRTGVRVPPINNPRRVFNALFVDTSAKDKQKQAVALKQHSSILDAVLGEARAFGKRLGKTDRVKLDEYLTSVREVEKKLGMSEQWLHRPKPEVDMQPPGNGPFVETLPVMYDLLALALQTDSTRVATLEIGGGIKTGELGLTTNYHKYSHHGKLPELVDGLKVIETYQMTHLSRFLDRLKAIPDPAGGTLLDQTMVLFGSGMGNGSSHSNKDLPIMLAGGGFRHGQHRVFPGARNKRVPLCNLYVSMLQNFGLEIDRFGTSTGTLAGLEVG